MKTINETKLRKIIREEVQKVLEEEFVKIRISLLPYVSDKEQREIEKMFGEKITEDKIVFKKEIEI